MVIFGLYPRNIFVVIKAVLYVAMKSFVIKKQKLKNNLLKRQCVSMVTSMTILE